MILYRSVSLQELELIYDGGMKAFPASLPQQPIFYPVLQLEYARQIAGARLFKPKFSYLSGKANPGTFSGSGLGSLFKSTTVEDSAVVVNLDKLYFMVDNEINAISLEEALSVVLEIYNFKLDDGFSVSEMFAKGEIGIIGGVYNIETGEVDFFKNLTQKTDARKKDKSLTT